MEHDHAELHPAYATALPERPTWPAIAKAMTGRCPNCGRGALFQTYLKLNDACGTCGQDLTHARADDGPAYLTILLTAKVMGTSMLFAFQAWQPSPYVLLTVFGLGTIAMALALLPRFKGLIVGVQWAKRMHGF